MDPLRENTPNRLNRHLETRAKTITRMAVGTKSLPTTHADKNQKLPHLLTESETNFDKYCRCMNLRIKRSWRSCRQEKPNRSPESLTFFQLITANFETALTYRSYCLAKRSKNTAILWPGTSPKWPSSSNSNSSQRRLIDPTHILSWASSWTSKLHMTKMELLRECFCCYSTFLWNPIRFRFQRLNISYQLLTIPARNKVSPYNWGVNHLANTYATENIFAEPDIDIKNYKQPPDLTAVDCSQTL